MSTHTVDFKNHTIDSRNSDLFAVSTLKTATGLIFWIIGTLKSRQKAELFFEIRNIVNKFLTELEVKAFGEDDE